MADARGDVVTLFVGFVLVFLVAFAFGLYIGRELGGGEAPVARLEPEEGGSEGLFGAPSEGRQEEWGRTEGRVEEETVVGEVEEGAGDEGELTVEEPLEPLGEEETEGEALVVKELEGSAGRESEEKGGDGVEASKESVASPETSPEISPEISSGEGSISEALEEMGRVKQEPAPAPRRRTTSETPAREEVASLPPISEGGRYTVQVASFPEEAKAQKLVNELRDRGYPAFTKKAQIAGRGTWYRVRVGTFKTRADARRYGEVLESRESSVVDTFITPNN